MVEGLRTANPLCHRGLGQARTVRRRPAPPEVSPSRVRVLHGPHQRPGTRPVVPVVRRHGGAREFELDDAQAPRGSAPASRCPLRSPRVVDGQRCLKTHPRTTPAASTHGEQARSGSRGAGTPVTLFALGEPMGTPNRPKTPSAGVALTAGGSVQRTAPHFRHSSTHGVTTITGPPLRSPYGCQSWRHNPLAQLRPVIRVSKPVGSPSAHGQDGARDDANQNRQPSRQPRCLIGRASGRVGRATSRTSRAATR